MGSAFPSFVRASNFIAGRMSGGCLSFARFGLDDGGSATVMKRTHEPHFSLDKKPYLFYTQDRDIVFLI